MTKGVNFTPDAARRISNVVREVEGRPFPANVPQRRRGGGLGRSSLWEVTAIQTGPKTCTIKRIENTDFDLIDPSEKIDILYDPGDVPAVGDRGLLIRLGEGSLFFFKRAVGAVPVYWFDKYAHVDKDHPDTSYTDKAIVEVTHDLGGFHTNHIAFIKFDRPIPYLSHIPDPQFYHVCNLGALWRDFLNVQVTEGPSVWVRRWIYAYKILNDFDATILTWNNWASEITDGGTWLRQKRKVIASTEATPSPTDTTLGGVDTEGSDDCGDIALHDNVSGDRYEINPASGQPVYGMYVKATFDGPIAPAGGNPYAQTYIEIRRSPQSGLPMPGFIAQLPIGTIP